MEKQIRFYEDKLAYEMDPSDLFESLRNGRKLFRWIAGKQLDTSQSISRVP